MTTLREELEVLGITNIDISLIKELKVYIRIRSINDFTIHEVEHKFEKQKQSDDLNLYSKISYIKKSSIEQLSKASLNFLLDIEYECYQTNRNSEYSYRNDEIYGVILLNDGSWIEIKVDSEDKENGYIEVNHYKKPVIDNWEINLNKII